MASFLDNDPLLGNYQQERLQLIEEFRRKSEMQGSRTPLWDRVDSEIAPLTDEQKKVVYADEEYVAVQAELAKMVQEQMLRMVKPYIEGSEKGKELLNKMYDIAVVAKKKAISETNKEMELFKRWQEYSVANPNATYAEFIKSTKKK
jgi:hypothetical protein